MEHLLSSDVLLKGLLGILTIIAVALFGKERWRKDRSSSNLIEAQDSEHSMLLETLRAERQSANERADKAYAELLVAREEAQLARQMLVDEMGQMKARSRERDKKVERQRKQLAALAIIVIEDRPHLAPMMKNSGFVDFDDSGGNQVKGRPP